MYVCMCVLYLCIRVCVPLVWGGLDFPPLVRATLLFPSQDWIHHRICQSVLLFTNIQKLRTTRLAWEQPAGTLCASWSQRGTSEAVEMRCPIHEMLTVSRFQPLLSTSSGPALAMCFREVIHPLPTFTLLSPSLHKGTGR